MTDAATIGDDPRALEPAVSGPSGSGHQRRRRPVLFMVAMAWLSLVSVAALLADVLPLADQGVDAGAGLRTRPFRLAAEPFGTDNFSRSILSRLVYGARVSLSAGLVAAALAFGCGLVAGVAAGYFRGKVDAVIGVLFDVILSFPGIVVLVALAATVQPGLTTVIVGLAIVAFPAFGRLARANTLALANAEFVMAARGLGAKASTIMGREIVPNVAGAMLAYASVVVAVIVLAEATLSFLNLGVPPPQATWGVMIAEGRHELKSHPHIALVPSAVLFMTIFSLNVVGEHFRSRAGPGVRR